APEQRLCRGGAQADEDLRLHDRELRVEPGPAGRDLRPRRLGVDPPLAACLPFEVLDDVRDVGARAVDACLLETLVEQPPRRPDEGMSFPVLPVAGLLPDEHQLRLRRALAEDGLRPGSPERTRLATGG